MKYNYFIEGSIEAKDSFAAERMIRVSDFKHIELSLEQEGLERWDENLLETEQNFVTINSIVVPTEYDKQQLLLAFEYLHNLREVDTDYHAVNTIAHIYTNPDLIEVSNA